MGQGTGKEVSREKVREERKEEADQRISETARRDQACKIEENSARS